MKPMINVQLSLVFTPYGRARWVMSAGQVSVEANTIETVAEQFVAFLSSKASRSCRTIAPLTTYGRGKDFVAVIGTVGQTYEPYRIGERVIYRDSLCEIQNIEVEDTFVRLIIKFLTVEERAKLISGLVDDEQIDEALRQGRQDAERSRVAVGPKRA